MPQIVIEKNVMVPMRDGVMLATDIYRMKGAFPCPVLVLRTPYNKDIMAASNDIFDIFRAVQFGYVVIMQDVRGRFASEGTFTPHVQEHHPGAYYSW